MKKAQFIGQVFVFIIAAILFALILVYGYKAIAKFGEQRQEVALIQFQDDLKSAVAKTAVDYGSVKKFTIEVPADYEEVCFVDLETIRTNIEGMPDFIANERPLIADSILGGSDQNVFLKPFPEQPIRIPPITVGGDNAEQGYLCIPNTNVGIVLKLTGMGDKAKIELWPME